MLSVSAPAKVNLSLEVVGRRPDGFHELVSVMRTISLCDRLDVKPGAGVAFCCSDDNLNTSRNLVVQAAHLLGKEVGTTGGCEIYLQKNIPTGAGLGGGSSDAAAALVALARIWGVSTSCEQFGKWAAHLGSDVPFFLYGGPALVEGRGEKVRRLPSAIRTSQWYVLASPWIEVSTREIFEALREEEWTDGSSSRKLAWNSLQSSAVGMNGLQSTLFHLYPEARTCYNEVERCAPGRTIVSGTGPTVVALVESEDEAHKTSNSLAKLGFWTKIATDYRMESWQTPCAQG